MTLVAVCRFFSCPKPVSQVKWCCNCSFHQSHNVKMLTFIDPVRQTAELKTRKITVFVTGIATSTQTQSQLMLQMHLLAASEEYWRFLLYSMLVTHQITKMWQCYICSCFCSYKPHLKSTVDGHPFSKQLQCSFTKSLIFFARNKTES